MHHTYAQMPVGAWLEDAMHLDRNHDDRLVLRQVIAVGSCVIMGLFNGGLLAIQDSPQDIATAGWQL